MKCTVCGVNMSRIAHDLPFKITEHTIIVLKSLPVFQCENYMEYLLEDTVLCRVDEIIANGEGVVELEIIRYAA